MKVHQGGGGVVGLFAPRPLDFKAGFLDQAVEEVEDIGGVSLALHHGHQRRRDVHR